MKKILTLTILFSLLFSCEKLDQLTQFNLSYDLEFDIDSGIPAGTSIQINDLELPIDVSDFDANNTTKDLLEEVKIETIELRILKPETANFDFLSDVDLYIAAEGLPKIRLAWKNDIPNGVGQVLTLDVLSDDLSEYLKKDAIQISADFITDEELTDPVTIQIHLVYFVDAKILGV